MGVLFRYNKDLGALPPLSRMRRKSSPEAAPPPRLNNRCSILDLLLPQGSCRPPSRLSITCTSALCTARSSQSSAVRRQRQRVKACFPAAYTSENTPPRLQACASPRKPKRSPAKRVCLREEDTDFAPTMRRSGLHPLSKILVFLRSVPDLSGTRKGPRQRLARALVFRFTGD